VNGNDSWYSLPPTLNEWVSAATYKTSELRRAGAEAPSASSGEPQLQ
jgi:hypothetical protein